MSYAGGGFGSPGSCANASAGKPITMASRPTLLNFFITAVPLRRRLGASAFNIRRYELPPTLRPADSVVTRVLRPLDIGLGRSFGCQHCDARPASEVRRTSTTRRGGFFPFCNWRLGHRPPAKTRGGASGRTNGGG